MGYSFENETECEDYDCETFNQVLDQNDDPAAFPNKLVHNKWQKKHKWLLGHPRSFHPPENGGDAVVRWHVEYESEESNPLALGIDWMDKEGVFVTVYMFDN